MPIKEFYEERYDEALPLLEELANKGNVEAQCALGDMYLNGLGVEENHKKSAYWYQKAADLDDSDAQYAIGAMYYMGLDVEKNYMQKMLISFW